MFDAKYSRMKFWLLSLLVILFGSTFMGVTKSIGAEGANLVATLVVLATLTYILANRIRGFGSNPWLALWSILPLVGLFQAFYYGCKKSGKMTQKE